MVDFKSKVFFRVFVGMLALLAVSGLLQVVLTRTWLRLLPVAFTGGVLYGVFRRRMWSKKAVRLWALLLAASGGLPLTFVAPQMSVSEALIRLVLLVVGVAFFWLSGRYIEADDSAHLDWRNLQEEEYLSQ